MIEILHPGLLASVQDCGRYGFRKYGVPISGAMDCYALKVSNILVGNSETEAGIEVTLGYGFKLRVENKVLIAITGGDLSPKVNNQSIPMWTPLWMRKEDILTFGAQRSGFRAYIAIQGGIERPFLMKSYSPMIGNSTGVLKSGDRLKIRPKSVVRKMEMKALSDSYVPEYKTPIQLSVILGPQDDYFTPEALEVFLNSQYNVTPQSNRQGYRLEGPALKHSRTYDLISEPVWPGSVQVPGDGLPIILCKDAQTTGGYPKIASVISADLDNLGQAKPSSKIFFKRMSIEEAHRLYLAQEERIQNLKRIVWGTANE